MLSFTMRNVLLSFEIYKQLSVNVIHDRQLLLSFAIFTCTVFFSRSGHDQEIHDTCAVFQA